MSKLGQPFWLNFRSAKQIWYPTHHLHGSLLIHQPHLLSLSFLLGDDSFCTVTLILSIDTLYLSCGLLLQPKKYWYCISLQLQAIFWQMIRPSSLRPIGPESVFLNGYNFFLLLKGIRFYFFSSDEPGYLRSKTGSNPCVVLQKNWLVGKVSWDFMHSYFGGKE